MRRLSTHEVPHGPWDSVGDEAALLVIQNTRTLPVMRREEQTGLFAHTPVPWYGAVSVSQLSLTASHSFTVSQSHILGRHQPCVLHGWPCRERSLLRDLLYPARSSCASQRCCRTAINSTVQAVDGERGPPTEFSFGSRFLNQAFQLARRRRRLATAVHRPGGLDVNITCRCTAQRWCGTAAPRFQSLFCGWFFDRARLVAGFPTDEKSSTGPGS